VVQPLLQAAAKFTDANQETFGLAASCESDHNAADGPGRKLNIMQSIINFQTYWPGYI
jgi:hypothetical protein